MEVLSYCHKHYHNVLLRSLVPKQIIIIIIMLSQLTFKDDVEAVLPLLGGASM